MALWNSSNESGGFTNDWPRSCNIQAPRRSSWASQVGFPPPSSRARGWQCGWPSAHLGSGLGDDTNPSCTLTHTKKQTFLGLVPLLVKQGSCLRPSESSHSNTAHLFASLDPPGPPAARTPSTVTEKQCRFPATGSTQRLSPPLPTPSSQLDRGLSVVSCLFQATLRTYFKLKSSGQKHKGLEKPWGVTSGFFRAIFPRACTDPCIRREPRARIYQMPVIHKSCVCIKGERYAYLRNLLYVNVATGLTK